MYKYLFGPVPSRRLGMSLGVDLVPSKVCSLDCVYCEVGKTTRLTCDRREYVLFEQVKAELEDFFSNNPDPDYITFSGAGEPTLNARMGDILSFIKQLRPRIPVAVLTNGTLFADAEVRRELLAADVVLPSLDAVSEDVFLKINRPEKDLTAADCVAGLVEFAGEYGGEIWLEIFVLPGYNDSEEELLKFREVIEQMRPTQVQLNTLDRPGAESGLRSATRKELEYVKSVLGGDNVVVVSKAPQRKQIVSYRSDVESAILETISRRPCTLPDLASILGRHVNEINKYLDVLEDEGLVVSRREERGVFYQAV